MALEQKFDNVESDWRTGRMDDFLKGFLKGSEFVDDPSTKWIKWKHISQGKTHCKDCLELDDCWFAKNQSPKAPLHPYCHCVRYQYHTHRLSITPMPKVRTVSLTHTCLT